jgi:hypothetical protein
MVRASVNGGEPRPALLDTGLPVTMLFGEAFTELAAGQQTIDLEAFNLRFRGLTAAVLSPKDEEPICAGDIAVGLLGWDLFGHFRVALDYRARRAFLFDDTRDEPIDFADDVEPPASIAVDLRGGGTLKLEDTQQQLSVPATRMIVEASVEGGEHAAMIDTGSSLTVISSQLYGQLESTDRPSFCCTTVALLDGTTSARIVRLHELRLGDVAVTGLPVVVLDRGALFAALGAEIGRPLHLLIGGSFLRRFATDLDYPQRSVRLWRYRDASHIDSDEYVLPGFNFCRAAVPNTGMVVINVFEGTDAGRKGVQSGHLLVGVDGADVRTRTAAEVAALIRGVGAGNETTLTFETTEGETAVPVTVERMLPDLP